MDVARSSRIDGWLAAASSGANRADSLTLGDKAAVIRPMPACGLVTVGECGSRLNAGRKGEKKEPGIRQSHGARPISNKNLDTERHRNIRLHTGADLSCRIPLRKHRHHRAIVTAKGSSRKRRSHSTMRRESPRLRRRLGRVARQTGPVDAKEARKCADMAPAYIFRGCQTTLWRQRRRDLRHCVARATVEFHVPRRGMGPHS